MRSAECGIEGRASLPHSECRVMSASASTTRPSSDPRTAPPAYPSPGSPRHGDARSVVATDRKSTRLNSSHVEISYAVFCLKKKKTRQTTSNRDSFFLLIASYYLSMSTKHLYHRDPYLIHSEYIDDYSVCDLYIRK